MSHLRPVARPDGPRLVLIGLLWCLGSTAAAQEPVVPTPSGIDLAAFDASVRPQDDFYAYANGGWVERTEIPPGTSGVSIRQAMRRQTAEAIRDIVEELSATPSHPEGSAEQLVADFFRSYMNSDRVESLGTGPVADRIAEIQRAESSAELMRLGARMTREGIVGPLDALVEVDLADSSRYVAWLRQSRLTLPSPAYYLDDAEEYAQVREGLPDYAARLFRLAGLSRAESRGRAVLELETKLAAVQQPLEEVRDVAGYHPHEVAALGELSPHIDWDGLLAALGLDGESRVVVTAPAYVEGLGRLLAGEPLGDWKDYWTFRLLNGRAQLLPEAFVQAELDYVSGVVGGVSEQLPRSARAISLISGELFQPAGVLEWPIAKLYVERHLSREAKEHLEEMIERLRAAYGRAIDGLDWMSAETKAEAKRKLENVFVRVAYPDTWPDYSALEITPHDLVGNVRRASAFAYQLELDKLSRRAERSDWTNRPHWMYALADLAGAAEFPAAFLQPPLFVPGTDDAYNYGSVGFVIGHELGHNFDSQGRLTDSRGVLRDWWAEEDAQEFERRAARLVAYYDAFEPLEGVHVDGERTLAENIADLAGLVVAYDAYVSSLGGEEAPVLDGLTGPQRFMIAYAQISRAKQLEPALRRTLLTGWGPPAKQRVNGPLRHLPEFHRAFGVREGDGMWIPPEERVKIW